MIEGESDTGYLISIPKYETPGKVQGAMILMSKFYTLVPFVKASKELAV